MWRCSRSTPVRRRLHTLQSGVLFRITGQRAAGRVQLQQSEQVRAVAGTEVTLHTRLEAIARTGVPVARRRHVGNTTVRADSIFRRGVPGFSGAVATFGLAVSLQGSHQNEPQFGVTMRCVGVSLLSQPVAPVRSHFAGRRGPVTRRSNAILRAWVFGGHGSPRLFVQRSLKVLHVSSSADQPWRCTPGVAG